MTEDGKLLGIVAAHVDTPLCAFGGSSGQGVKQHLTLSKESEFNLSSCGRVRQAVEDGDCSIHVACEATTRMISEIRFEGSHVHVRKAAHERLTASEQEQYQSLTGSLQWVRLARVGPQAVASKLQQMKKLATVASPVLATKVFKYLEQTQPVDGWCSGWGSFAGKWDTS